MDGFDCGEPALNNYLKRHAGVSYVAIEEAAPRTVLGYFTLAAASVPRDMLPKKHVRGLPPYDLPLVLLARLAVDRRSPAEDSGTRCGRGVPHQLARRR